MADPQRARHSRLGALSTAPGEGPRSQRRRIKTLAIGGKRLYCVPRLDWGNKQPTKADPKLRVGEIEPTLILPSEPSELSQPSSPAIDPSPWRRSRSLPNSRRACERPSLFALGGQRHPHSPTVARPSQPRRYVVGKVPKRTRRTNQTYQTCPGVRVSCTESRHSGLSAILPFHPRNPKPRYQSRLPFSRPSTHSPTHPLIHCPVPSPSPRPRHAPFSLVSESSGWLHPGPRSLPPMPEPCS